MVKAVLFDMDGVLIDAREWHYEALNKALAIFGHKISRQDHLLTFDGLPTHKKLRMLSDHQSLPSQLHDFINLLKQNYTMEMVQLHCKPSFNHEYALSRLKMKGFKLALCSNSVRESIYQMLSKANILEYFDIIMSNQDISNPKPDPEIYTQTIAKFSLSAKDCLIIEDNEHGINAAITAKGNVLIVGDPSEVTWQSISKMIEKINQNPEQQLIVKSSELA